MNQKYVIRIVVAVMLIVAIFFTNANASEPPALTKSQAAQILGFMAFVDIQVVAIVPGSAGQSLMNYSPYCVTVIGIARQNGQVEKIDLPFYYDTDRGWFHYEYDNDENPLHPLTKLRLWTIKGYQEIQPMQTANTVQLEPALPKDAGPTPEQSEALKRLREKRLQEEHTTGQ